MDDKNFAYEEEAMRPSNRSIDSFMINITIKLNPEFNISSIP
jgi:hypothetical protein